VIRNVAATQAVCKVRAMELTTDLAAHGEVGEGGDVRVGIIRV
jgi:hypothetical protein